MVICLQLNENEPQCWYRVNAVILAPYGLRAYLVGARSRETEQVKRMLDEWYQFYAMKGLDVESEEDGSQRLPAIVEVTVGKLSIPQCI